jgi:hypothetical protein
LEIAAGAGGVGSSGLRVRGFERAKIDFETIVGVSPGETTE